MLFSNATDPAAAPDVIMDFGSVSAGDSGSFTFDTFSAAVVPLPPAAWGGMGLYAMMGVWRVGKARDRVNNGKGSLLINNQ